ncbi:hypothetical protein LR090_01520 [Candidatus Bipolaricaulota bacterium]|nr:hypothetical protein [Candidatus Bipolaricaulota bacterium]
MRVANRSEAIMAKKNSREAIAASPPISLKLNLLSQYPRVAKPMKETKTT